MDFSDRTRRVVVIGAGLGGTATAVRLLHFAREPLQVVLLERRPEYRGAGVAYHREGNHWNHVFNIQAGRMGMFREDVDDFVAWLNKEADRGDWPDEWRDFEFTESGPAPRRVYPDYLADRLAEAAREAPPGSTLVEADGEAVDVEVVDGQVHVVVEGFSAPGVTSDRTVLRADHLVVATGLERRRPAFASEVTDHPAFVGNPYSDKGIEQVLAARPDATVAIIGTLLSAYDSAALLLRRGHTGKIHMISRSGLTLRTYPADHRHEVFTLPAPQLHADAYEGREDLIRRFRAEWERACAAIVEQYPDVAPAIVTERVSKSWEPYLPPVLERIPSAELRALLDSYGSLLATLRVSAVAYTTELVDAAMARGVQVFVTTGAVERIAPAETGGLVLTVGGRNEPKTIEADLVISNFGRESDYERAESTLWTNLVAKGLAVPHRRTGRGFDVDVHGNLLDASGAPSGPICVIGTLREGDEIVRYGRMGAFTFNLAAIKNHSVGVAATVLRRLESCYDDPADAVLTDTAEVHEAFSHSVMLDVRRMAVRDRREGDALADLLDERIEEIRGITARHGGDPAPARALRCAVNAAATTKLNDLSVTPRELRSLLGLDHSVALT